MQNLLKKIKAKINQTIIGLLALGLIMVMLSILIVWTDFVLELIFGFFVLLVAFSFFYLAYKIWWIKKEIEKYFKI